MSACAKVDILVNNTGAYVGVAMACIVQGVQELNYAYERQKEMVDCDNQIRQVDLLIKTLEGKMIGVIQQEKNVQFVVQDINCAITQDALKKIKQRYSKYAVLHELKAKGYDKVKEERLPNGKIRMVVEKWE